MIPTTIVGPARWQDPEPPDRTFNGVRRPKVPTRLRKKVAWLLKNEPVVLVGWCSLYRPGADSNDFHMRLDRSMKELWVCPPGAEDPEEMIGPYGWDDAKAFAAKGRTLVALAATLEEMAT